MRAIDTSLLIRLLTRDDPEQVPRAEEVVQRGAWVSHVVLVEAMGVLDSVYNRNNDQVSLAVSMLLEHSQLVLQDPDVVRNALSAFKSHRKVGFSDCMILAIAQKAGNTPVGAFDRDFSKLDDMERV